MKITPFSLKTTIAITVAAMIIHIVNDIALEDFYYAKEFTTELLDNYKEVYLLSFIPMVLFIYVIFFFQSFLHQVIGSRRLDGYIWIFFVSTVVMLMLNSWLYYELFLRGLDNISNDNLVTIQTSYALCLFIIFIVDIIFLSKPLTTILWFIERRFKLFLFVGF